MIKVKKYREERVKCFDPDGKSLGFLNETELADLQLQIAKEEVIGYYIQFKRKRFDINKYGAIINYPSTLFNRNMKLYADRIKLKISKKKNKTIT